MYKLSKTRSYVACWLLAIQVLPLGTEVKTKQALSKCCHIGTEAKTKQTQAWVSSDIFSAFWTRLELFPMSSWSKIGRYVYWHQTELTVMGSTGLI